MGYDMGIFVGLWLFFLSFLVLILFVLIFVGVYKVSVLNKAISSLSDQLKAALHGGNIKSTASTKPIQAASQDIPHIASTIKQKITDSQNIEKYMSSSKEEKTHESLCKSENFEETDYSANNSKNTIAKESIQMPDAQKQPPASEESAGFF